MRILQVFNRYLQKGGEEHSVERISNTLALRHEVKHCYFDTRQMTQPAGLEGRLCALQEMVWNPAARRKFLTLRHLTRPDVILLHNIFPYGSAALLQAALASGLPVVQFLHNFRPYSVNAYLWADGRIQSGGLRKNFWPEIRAGAWQNSRLKTAIYGSLLWTLHALGFYRRIDQWIAISDFLRDRFIQAGVRPHKIHTLRHSWNRQVSTLEQKPDAGYFLFLGRLLDAKGVQVMLEAWKNAPPDECPVLKIAGEGPLETEVRAAAAANPRIEFLGQVHGEEKRQLLTDCRALLAPSLWWEALGLVTYEAYDYGKPMLAARSGALPETVQHGKTGFLHEPGHHEELLAHVLTCHRSPEKAAAMGRAGRQWLESHTDRDTWLDNFETILENLMRRRTSKG